MFIDTVGVTPSFAGAKAGAAGDYLSFYLKGSTGGIKHEEMQS